MEPCDHDEQHLLQSLLHLIDHHRSKIFIDTGARSVFYQRDKDRFTWIAFLTSFYSFRKGLDATSYLFSLYRVCLERDGAGSTQTVTTSGNRISWSAERCNSPGPSLPLKRCNSPGMARQIEFHSLGLPLSHFLSLSKLPHVHRRKLFGVDFKSNCRTLKELNVLDPIGCLGKIVNDLTRTHPIETRIPTSLEEAPNRLYFRAGCPRALKCVK